MEINFEKLSLLEKRKLTIEELCEYKRNERQFLAYSDQKLKGVNIRKTIHPIINVLIKGRRIRLHQTLTTTGCVPKNPEKRPIIFAVTHTGKYDIEIVNEAIKKSYYLLSDDEEYMYRTVDGYFTEANGVIYVDSDYYEDMAAAKIICEKALSQGANIMWFPEGIWNLSPNLLVLPFKYGIIDSALKTNALILPVAIDQRKDDFYVNIGQFIYPEKLPIKGLDDKEGKIVSATILRDQMATLKWELWEKHPIESRSHIPNDYYEKFIDARIAEWPYFTREVIEGRIFKVPGVVSFEDVLAEPHLRMRREQELEKEKISAIFSFMEQDISLSYEDAEKMYADSQKNKKQKTLCKTFKKAS